MYWSLFLGTGNTAVFLRPHTLLELTFHSRRGNKAKSIQSMVDSEKGYGKNESMGEGQRGLGGVAIVIRMVG